MLRLTIATILLSFTALLLTFEAGLVAGKGFDITHTPGYWTEERMRNATPPVPSEARRLRDQARYEELKAQGKLELAFCTGSEETLLTDFQQYQQQPYYAIGKVFFKVGGGDYVCSASIGQPSKYVWTAGHCLYDSEVKQQVEEFVFVPQYFDRTTPLGYYSAVHGWIPDNYVKQDQIEYDYGIAGFDQELPAQYGSFALAVNVKPSQTTYIAYGYPQAPPFDGEYINQCRSLGCIRDPTTSPETVGIDCTSTSGSSGGPWLINSNTQIAGVVSYGYPSKPGVLFSPYFDTETREFYDAVINGADPGLIDTGDGGSSDTNRLRSLSSLLHLILHP